MRTIDADALKQHYNVPDAEGVFSYCDTIMRVIDEQPTIEAEPVRHGLWMKIEPTIKLQSRWKCSRSKCGGIVHAITDYCPYCGARMDGGADNG